MIREISNCWIIFFSSSIYEDLRRKTYPYVCLFVERVARDVNPPQPSLLLRPEAVGGREEMPGGEKTAGTVVNSLVPQTGQPQTHPIPTASHYGHQTKAKIIIKMSRLEVA